MDFQDSQALKNRMIGERDGLVCIAGAVVLETG